MAMVELVAKYGGVGTGGWETPDNVGVGRHAAFDYEGDEQNGSSDIGLEGSYAVQRLYRPRRGRFRTVTSKRAVQYVGVADLAFMAFPTVAFSLAIVGLVAAMLAFVENEPAYLMPGALAALGFSVLGCVAYYLAYLMKKATRGG